MPQLTDLVLSDGAATPVAHTFKPLTGVDANGVATLAETAVGVPMARPRVAVGRTRTTAGREKVTFKMTVPVLVTATVNGVQTPAVPRTAYADVVFSFDGTSTVQERKDIRMMLADLIGNDQAFASAVVDNLESLY